MLLCNFHLWYRGLWTRGIHFDLASSMSTKHFLLAFRRFISRRGSCSIVYSDNAKSFKATSKDLIYFAKILKNLEFKDFISSRGITWKFIVERAPWWGGFYERLVKLVKDPLRKILGKALLTFEELATILIEIEYTVNSRPLTYVMDDFSEPNPLTPLDFLQYGRKNHDYPLHFAELANKVKDVTKGEDKDSHTILEDCLQDIEWVTEMFQDMLEMWNACDKYR
ncbi:integrase catalytic domain-containing protein [Trichonephila clavipes]|nr:integrase catalytic domain-containing protein [Trichonephila clavipes]